MADYGRRTDGFSGYTVRDPNRGTIGKVADLFLDGNGEPGYLGVKTGFLETKSTLIPMDACTVDESRGFVEVSVDKETAKNGPAFEDEGEITPEYGRRVRRYYGLGPAEERGPRDRPGVGRLGPLVGEAGEERAG